MTAQPQDAGAVVTINHQTTTSLSVVLGTPGTNTQIDIDVSAPVKAYMQAMTALPAWREWRRAALRETWVIPKFEYDWPEVKRLPADAALCNSSSATRIIPHGRSGHGLP